MKIKILICVFVLVIVSISVYSADVVVRNGALGIGIGTPTQALDVNGNIKGIELCIGTNCKDSWPNITWSRSGTLTYLNNSADNVGIGTLVIAAQDGYTPKIVLSSPGNTVHSIENPAGSMSGIRFFNAGDSEWYFFSRGTAAGGPANRFAIYSADGVGAPNERITILQNGRVGIGTNNPQDRLHVNGDVRANGFIPVSDVRLKTNIKPIKGLDIINNLTGVSFTWKNTGKKSAGLIAQEVEKIMPEAVSNTNGIRGLNYDSLTAPLVESIKELTKKNSEQEKRILNLESEIAVLKQEIQKIRGEKKN